MEEENLSQQMKQLSTNTTKPKDSFFNEIKTAIETIPNYLTKRNKSFKHMIDQILSTMKIATTTTDNMDDVRKIAILNYKIMIIQIYQLLWTTYLKAGMGQLIIPSSKKLSYSTTLSIWPKEIKTMILSKSKKKTTNQTEICLKFVNDQLNALNYHLKQYQMELNIKVNTVQGYTSIIQKIIETYIEQNLQRFRMEIEHKIELIHYDYHIEALKLEYYQLNPNSFQKQLMKELCQSKHEQETTEQEVHFLEQQIVYYNSPSQSFERSSLAHDPLIDSIQDPAIRQQLFQQRKEIAEQARANIFTLYMKTAEEQQEEYKTKHEINIKKMWNAYHSTSDQEKLSPKMLDLIHQRCMKIAEHIQYIYKFKTHSLISNSKS